MFICVYIHNVGLPKLQERDFEELNARALALIGQIKQELILPDDEVDDYECGYPESNDFDHGNQDEDYSEAPFTASAHEISNPLKTVTLESPLKDKDETNIADSSDAESIEYVSPAEDYVEEFQDILCYCETIVVADNFSMNGCN